MEDEAVVPEIRLFCMYYYSRVLLSPCTAQYYCQPNSWVRSGRGRLGRSIQDGNPAINLNADKPDRFGRPRPARTGNPANELNVADRGSVRNRRSLTLPPDHNVTRQQHRISISGGRHQSN
jgi:hypothetical protein